jgi:dipeptidyl aminopeptidase/acylaminoacyl peptidase
MHKSSFSRLAALAVMGVAAWAGAQTTQPVYKSASEIPVEAFFRRAQFSQMVLSPDGTRLAALSPRNGRDNLVIIDLKDGKRLGATNFSDYDISHFEWIDNQRLYLTVADLAEASGQIRYRGAFAVDADGSNFRDLSFPFDRGTQRSARRDSIQLDATQLGLNILSKTFDGSGDVIAQLYGRSKTTSDVYRYNTRTGEYKLLTFDNPGNVVQWVLDRDLVPRIALRREERSDPGKARQTTLWHRSAIDKPFENIGVASGGDGEGSIWPIAFDYDNKTLYVSSNRGRDKRAIYRYDISEKKLGELLVEHPLIDLAGGLVFDRSKKKLMAIRYSADQPDTAWFDEESARFQASVDAALPGRINRVFIPDESQRYVLIHSQSATDAGGYFLFDKQAKKLQQISQTRPWLPPERMGERRFVRYTTRDGKTIPAWVTLPRDSNGKNLPLVVHVHGGPSVRAYHGVAWGRWPDAQFLASRGYAVLEPEPRGSTGFGVKHYTSGFKQWGLAAQDDLTDGALHLVKEGIVDRSRMCLYGGSYGGYAALQGLVKDPDLWRCGVATVAVTDLELLQTVSWSDTARFSDYLETDFKRRVGDKDTDRDQFASTSPARNAHKIKAAVMLTMGGEDIRVPIIHGTTFKDAMEKAGKVIDYKVYPDEAHGFNKDDNVFDFYSRLEKFLAKHLKPAAP